MLLDFKEMKSYFDSNLYGSILVVFFLFFEGCHLHISDIGEMMLLRLWYEIIDEKSVATNLMLFLHFIYMC